MFRIPRSEIALACLVFLLTAGSVMAHGYEAGSLKIGHPWSRATPDGAQVAGGYLKITNTGTEPDRLVGGSFERSARFEIHEMKVTDGTMTMRPIEGGLIIAPGETVALEPGGLHLMFTGLTGKLAEKEKVKGTLVFEKAGSVDVEFAVAGMGSKDGKSSGPDSGVHKHH